MKVVVPSRFPDLLGSLFDSMERSQPRSTSAVVVGDNGLTERFKNTWQRATYHDLRPPFVYAYAVNALAATFRDDILIMGDDTRVASWGWLDKVEELFARWPIEYGMLNLCERKLEDPAPVVEAAGPLAFVATAIPRRVWRGFGGLDERFTGYGYDDIDWCVRIHRGGLRIGVSTAVMVRHAGTASYKRVYGSAEAVEALKQKAHETFRNKWGFDMTDPFKPWGWNDA